MFDIWFGCFMQIDVDLEFIISMVSCQKGPTHHAYAWQIGPFGRIPSICSTPLNIFRWNLDDKGMEDAVEYVCIIFNFPKVIISDIQ